MSHQKISIDTINKIAILAKLELSEKEAARFAGEFTEIVNFVDKLQQVNLDGIDAMEQVLEGDSFLRDDLVKAGPGVEAMLKNAPDQVQNLVRVPKVVG